MNKLYTDLFDYPSTLFQCEECGHKWESCYEIEYFPDGSHYKLPEVDECPKCGCVDVEPA